jgi:hypothetical protein
MKHRCGLQSGSVTALECIPMLLERGADVNAKGFRGSSVLFVAVDQARDGLETVSVRRRLAVQDLAGAIR